MSGTDVIRVVHRLRHAQEDNNLDLSACHLLHIPDAVYLMLRDTPVETCDLSNNKIRRIPAKFAVKFKAITELRLRGNQVIGLPSEFADLECVRSLDLSDNELIAIPDAVYRMRRLATLNVNNNNIVDIDERRLSRMRSLQEIYLMDNPLSESARRALVELTAEHNIVIRYTEPEISSSYEDMD